MFRLITVIFGFWEYDKWEWKSSLVEMKICLSDNDGLMCQIYDRIA
jgi:hypothetical protein